LRFIFIVMVTNYTFVNVSISQHNFFGK
jgi:hypothetical protein